jgi:hypothetical protein
MRKKFIARTAKLLSEARKSKLHQGIAITYEHIPNDGEERNHGSIYALINVNADAKSAEEVAESIIDTFHGEYYNDLNRDPLSSFEAAIARVNEELAEITHQGNINWINKLNAVLAVLADTTLHVTQSGKAEAYLYRAGRSSHITQELTGDNINPLRTFINIASGELSEGDKVAMVTPDIFYHLSKNELQKYVEEFQPRIAISHLADILEGTAAHVKPNAILLLEAITPEAASGETYTDAAEEIWIEEPSRTVETVVEKSAPFFKKVIQYAKIGTEATSVFFVDKLIPKTKEIFAATQTATTEAIKNRNSRKLEGKPFLDEEFSETTPFVEEPKADVNDLLINEGANEFAEEIKKPETNKNLYIKETQNKPKWLKIEKINLSGAKKIGRHAGKYYGKIKNNKINLAIFATLVILVLGGSIYSTWQAREKSEQKQLASASLAEARNKFELAKTLINNGERAKASETLRNALAIANGITHKELKPEAEALAKEITASIDLAEGVIRPNIEKLGDASSIVGSNPFGPFAIGNNLYLINSENGTVAAIDVKSGEVSNIIENPKYEGKITAATAVTARSTLVFFTDKGNIYEVDTKDIKLTEQDTSGEIENPTELTAFSTNLYSLEGGTGKIYKRLKSGAGYTSRTEYITDNSNINGSKSLAIDSSVYVLDSNGKIIKFLSGKKQDFNLKESPVSLNDAEKVFANEDVKDIYLLSKSNGRIYRISTDGKYLGQYVSDQIKSASGVFIEDETTTTYFAQNGVIYKFKY